ncbi:unnamed protein product [Caenorhabditis brenneri]
MSNAYIIYTDGSTVNNGRAGARGGYGVVFVSERYRDTSGYFTYGNQTNNRYELEAIKIATEVALDVHSHHILIRTDSEYSKKSITTWLKTWKQNGFITANGEPVQNRQLIVEIDDNIRHIRAQGKIIQIEHVRGHSFDYFNNEADRLARIAANNNTVHEQRFVGNFPSVPGPLAFYYH